MRQPVIRYAMSSKEYVVLDFVMMSVFLYVSLFLSLFTCSHSNKGTGSSNEG